MRGVRALALLVVITVAITKANVVSSVTITNTTAYNTTSVSTIVLCNYTIPLPNTTVVGNYTITTCSTSAHVPAPLLLALFGAALLRRKSFTP